MSLRAILGAISGNEANNSPFSFTGQVRKYIKRSKGICNAESPIHLISRIWLLISYEKIEDSLEFSKLPFFLRYREHWENLK